MDFNIINLSIGMVLLMTVNITLGSLNAIFDGKFNWKKFIKGVGKSTVVALCIGTTYYAGSLNPDILVMELNGTQVNLLTAVYTAIFSAYLWYAKEDVIKIYSLIVPSKKKDGK